VHLCSSQNPVGQLIGAKAEVFHSSDPDRLRLIQIKATIAPQHLIFRPSMRGAPEAI
jgi:hypothetical protein